MDTAPTRLPGGPGYVGRSVTKPPTWHGLVAWDVLLNNLTTGLFLTAALGELVAPEDFRAVGRAAYPVALLLLVADLLLLTLDLGDPLRFLFMLRTFKPRSPMSLGSWCLTVYSLPLTVLVGLSLLPGAASGLDWLRRAALIAGLPFALGSALYKGVLFSTTAQPAWKDARWLGAYLANSALLLGGAQLLALSILLGQQRAAALLRLALLLLLPLLAADVREALWLARPRRSRVTLAVGVLGCGMLVPVILLAVGGLAPMLAAVLLLVGGALVVRFVIVDLPHARKEAVG
jgi:Ni/Fe-hydrogenase subunit HybB-like protein